MDRDRAVRDYGNYLCEAATGDRLVRLDDRKRCVIEPIMDTENLVAQTGNPNN